HQNWCRRLMNTHGFKWPMAILWAMATPEAPTEWSLEDGASTSGDDGSCCVSKVAHWSLSRELCIVGWK
ncbi:hypothetical protein PanWU01x14_277370, partial [Parasponia andersonii]